MIPGRKQAEHLKKDQGRAPGLSEKRIIDGGGCRQRRSCYGQGETERQSSAWKFWQHGKVEQCGLFPDWLIWLHHWPTPLQGLSTWIWHLRMAGNNTHASRERYNTPNMSISCLVQLYFLFKHDSGSNRRRSGPMIPTVSATPELKRTHDYWRPTLLYFPIDTAALTCSIHTK